jgi:hypothetical protein
MVILKICADRKLSNLNFNEKNKEFSKTEFSLFSVRIKSAPVSVMHETGKAAGKATRYCLKRNAGFYL